ncbi:MAG: hypothetical protein HY287_18415 [Planctomycetes bacterium]|nr:hypothetical protein [Planctomycetota bacterium]
MDLDEHLSCPKCGYDLHGIPAIRCPECGFRYDAAALRSLAADALWIRLAAARELTVRATQAGFLALPSLFDSFGISGGLGLGLIAVAYIGTFGTWATLTDAFDGMSSVPRLMKVFIGVGLGICYLVPFFPIFFLA